MPCVRRRQDDDVRIDPLRLVHLRRREVPDLIPGGLLVEDPPRVLEPDRGKRVRPRAQHLAVDREGERPGALAPRDPDDLPPLRLDRVPHEDLGQTVHPPLRDHGSPCPPGTPP